MKFQFLTGTIRSSAHVQEDDVLVDSDNDFRVKLSIVVNRELVYELARLGDSVNVISPPALVQQLSEFHKSAWQQYEVNAFGHPSHPNSP